MIVRNVDLNDLTKFDFYNDGKDTYLFLMGVGRLTDAKRFKSAFDRWLKHQFCNDREKATELLSAIRNQHKIVTGDPESIIIDAARYRWLRKQNWNDGELAVVVDPKKSVKLGVDCPSLDRLDAAIDEAMKR